MNITIISDSIYTKKSNPTITMAKAFAERGHKVNVILPFYEKHYSDKALEFEFVGASNVKIPKGDFDIKLYSLNNGDICYYFISNNKLFSREKEWGYSDDAVRTMMFCTASIETLLNNDIAVDSIISDCPNTSLISVLLKLKYHTSARLRNIKCYQYINKQNNARYDKSVITSVFGLSPDEKHILICKNEVNLTKAAIICASRIFVGENAVSILYDRNDDLHHTVIQFGFKIRKIRLGIDYSTFSPEYDVDIHKPFSTEDPCNRVANKLFVQKYLYLKESADIPLIVLYQNRNNDIWHKYKHELTRCDIQIIIVSDKIKQGDMPMISERCIYIQDKSTETLKNIFSAADFCVFGCLDSECSNPAFIAASYGCVPILPRHRFYDHGFSYFNKLTLDGNGYTYDPNIPTDILYTLWDALGVYRHDKKTYQKLLQNTMKKVFSASESIEIIEKETEKTVYSFI